MKKYLLAFLITLAVAVSRAAPGWCGEDVVLKVRPGLAGVYKVPQPVLIRVDIDNSGKGIRGELALAFQDREGYPGRRPPVYLGEVEIPAGGKISQVLVVPGELAANSPLVRLLDGDRILAEAKLEGAAVGGGMVILQLGEKMSGSGLFIWLDKTYGGQVTVKYLPPEELPEKSLFMGAADVIVVDREACARLNSKQSAALKEWVRLGGRLLISGQAGAAPGEPFSDLNPAGRGGAGDSGMLSRITLGRGEVILTGQALENISDPEGKTWEAMGFPSKDVDFVKDRANEIKYMLSDTGSYFPMVKIPGVPVLTLLWVIYVLVIGPGLYLALKRFNRRDLAWALIPAGAALTALTFYAMSPVNRLQAYLAHTVATVDIVDENLAEVRASGAFVLPRGGNLEVAGRGQILLEPVNYYMGRRNRPVSVFNNGEQSRVVYNNVEYGSMRQVHSCGILPGAGRIGGKVFFREDRVMGEITNDTPFNLRDCRLLLGKSFIELGDMPAGGSKKLNDSINTAIIMTNPEEPYNIKPQPPAGVRESRIITSLAGVRDSAGDVLFMGWSDSPVDQFKVAGPSGQGNVSGLTLVRQKMGLEFPGGPFRLPVSFVKSAVTGISGGYSIRPDGLFVHGGAVKITYDLQKTLGRKDFRVTAIEVPPLPPRSAYTVEIYRRDTGAWEQLNPGGQRFAAADVAKYLSARGKIEIRLTSKIEKSEGVFQGIAVEGVIGE